jgi:uncharacterized protein
MKTWIVHRPALSYYFLTLLLSWGYWLSLLALGIHVGPGSIAHFPGLLGPMFAALLVTAVIAGKQGVCKMLGRMFCLRSPWVSRLLVGLSPLGLGALAAAVLLVMGKALPPLNAFTYIPGLPANWPFAAVLAAVMVVNGLGEETGWRGFLLEQLLPGQHRFKATLVVGCLWALWHLPLFWLNASMASMGWLTILGWLFALICGAFILTQVYLTTGHSILCAALWHVAFNMVVSSSAGDGLFAAVVSMAVIAWGATLAVLWWRKGARLRRA